MTTANLIMLALGVTSFLLGVAILLRRGGSEGARVARRMVGTMFAALGLILTIFALGLSGGARGFANA
ncbi:MAG: hypothetical protein H0W65_03365 [Sphingomonas sp.]|uniref:hypothetical protein n=1 Tax=Sphingomonas sp. TaxID=28214 RepID=UPI0017B12CA8|nr:hypothetical protein [Sphingomonas sp.]MBA3666747.1 hypothetical protein [Sphingomonas sp.]